MSPSMVPDRRMACWTAAVFLTVALAGQALAEAQPTTDEKTKTEQAEVPVNGEVLFATSCGWCHQQGGRAAGRGPKLAGSKRDDDFILNRIKRGKQGAMPSFEHSFNDEQIQAILAYIRALPAQ